MKDPSYKNIPSSARLAKLLGQLSIAALILSIIIGYMVEIIGINSLLFSFAIPLSIAAIIVSTIARRDLGDEDRPGYREAVLGQRLGIVSLGIMLFFIIAVAVFFMLALLAKPS